MLIFEIILKDAFFSDLLLQMKTKVEESNFQQNWICNLTSHEYHLAVSRQGWALNSLSPHHASYKGCQTQPAGFIPFLSEQLHGTLFVFSLSCSSIWLKFLSLITHPSASSFFFAPYCIPACYITVHIKIEPRCWVFPVLWILPLLGASFSSEGNRRHRASWNVTRLPGLNPEY